MQFIGPQEGEGSELQAVAQHNATLTVGPLVDSALTMAALFEDKYIVAWSVWDEFVYWHLYL